MGTNFGPTAAGDMLSREDSTAILKMGQQKDKREKMTKAPQANAVNRRLPVGERKVQTAGP